MKNLLWLDKNNFVLVLTNVLVDKITQKGSLHLPENQLVFITQISDLSHIWEVEKRNLSVDQVEPDPFLKKVDQKTVALAKTFLTI